MKVDMSWRAAGAAIVGLLAGVSCATPASRAPEAPQDGPASIHVNAQPVALNPSAPGEVRVGRFTYAGGIVLTSADSDRVHGLSDIEIRDGELIAVSDLGALFRGRLLFDDAGALSGLSDAQVAPLLNEDGTPVEGKGDGDAEGLAVLNDGSILVSFERRHRIWRYLSGAGRPASVPWPGVDLPSNGGMEALGADPESGPDAYVVGAEESGDTWRCRVSGTCVPWFTVQKPEEFGLVAIRRLPGDRTALLLRAFDDRRGNRNTLEILDGTSVIDRLELAPPMTVDNYEGLAAVADVAGAFRFYLLSDDNDSSRQRTILLAFDWRAP
jgi:hypothetical protein